MEKIGSDDDDDELVGKDFVYIHLPFNAKQNTSTLSSKGCEMMKNKGGPRMMFELNKTTRTSHIAHTRQVKEIEWQTKDDTHDVWCSLWEHAANRAYRV